MQGKVEICGINTARLEILKNDEMMELLRRTKQGDMAARERLIRGNLRLVLSVIQRFSSRGENADDLFQVGCIGLIKAIDNFDIRQPVRFSTYGVPMIVGEIRRYLRDNSTLRVSRSMRDTAYKVLQARERLLRQQQREPTVEQIAQELELPREEVVFAMDAMSAPVSLYEPVYADGGDAVCVMDQIRDDHSSDEGWLQQLALKDAISHLQPRERNILSGQDPDGGVLRDRHLAGAGEPVGEKCHTLHQAGAVKKGGVSGDTPPFSVDIYSSHGSLLSAFRGQESLCQSVRSV